MTDEKARYLISVICELPKLGDLQITEMTDERVEFVGTDEGCYPARKYSGWIQQDVDNNSDLSGSFYDGTIGDCPEIGDWYFQWKYQDNDFVIKAVVVRFGDMAVVTATTTDDTKFEPMARVVYDAEFTNSEAFKLVQSWVDDTGRMSWSIVLWDEPTQRWIGENEL